MEQCVEHNTCKLGPRREGGIEVEVWEGIVTSCSECPYYRVRKGDGIVRTNDFNTTEEEE